MRVSRPKSCLSLASSHSYLLELCPLNAGALKFLVIAFFVLSHILKIQLMFSSCQPRKGAEREEELTF